ncbi:MAG: hypothetical protein AB7P04_00580 [Bacteriovoracia bacterium]
MKKFSLWVSLFTLLGAAPVMAGEPTSGLVPGPGSSGGGDTCALEFIETARTLRRELGVKYPEALQKIDLNLFQQMIDAVSVECVERTLVLNGVVKEAINTPAEKKILVSRQAWVSIQNPRKKVALVLHEYLGIMGVEDGKYQVSSWFLGGGEVRYVTDGSSFLAEPGSMLADYDQAAAALSALSLSKQRDSVKAKAVEILKTYFGFDEVKFASFFGAGSDEEVEIARFVATHLRETLPANFNLNAYVGLKWRHVSSKARARDQGNWGSDNKKYVIVFDDSRDGIGMDAKVLDVKPPKGTVPGMEVQLSRLELYTLNVGWQRFLAQTSRFKSFFSLMMNYEDLYYQPNLDIPVH